MNIKNISLNNGNHIPSLGLGTWNADKANTGKAVAYALTQAGYTHIDCASVYGNEKEIGQALTNSFSKGIKREDIFLTSKLWNTDHRKDHVQEAVKKTLQDLQLDYLDLYLVHWGMAFIYGQGEEPIDKDGYIMLDNIPLQETWEAMENLVKQGLVKSIGVANFSTPMLIDLLTYANIKPAVNQIELHPYNSQPNLVAYCNYLGIAVTAYSPLATPAAAPEEYPILLQDAIIKALAEKYKKTPAQIALRWGVQRGTAVIPKSTNIERLKENSNIFNFEFSEEDMQTLDALNKNLRYVDPIGWYKMPYFA